jgi:hypothetical protein
MLMHAVSILFYGYLTIATLTKLPNLIQTPDTNPKWRLGLLDGTNVNYPDLGGSLKPFKFLLPNEIRSFSIISGLPYQQESPSMKEFYRIGQGVFCPLLVNFEPGEQFAIVIAPDSETAAERLNASGYIWLQDLGQGKGVARKIK